jgi:hypothetical protein
VGPHAKQTFALTSTNGIILDWQWAKGQIKYFTLQYQFIDKISLRKVLCRVDSWFWIVFFVQIVFSLMDLTFWQLFTNWCTVSLSREIVFFAHNSKKFFLIRYIAGREETWPWLSWILDDVTASFFVMVTGFTSEVAVDKKVLSNHREKLSLTLLCIFDTILEMTLVTWHKTEIHVITHGSLPQQRSQISARLSWTSNSLKERQAIFKLPVKSNAPNTHSPSNDAK